MSENVLMSLGVVVLLGFSAQWLSWRIKIPSIVLLLLFGIIAGPVLGYLNPDELFGDVLMPFVSISVAIILFEGGMTLKLHEFRKIGHVVMLLISLGVIVTWIIVSFSAYWLFGLNLKVAALLGAVLTVTGPTVIGPLLRNIRPKQSVGNILKWEGILIDPIGALLAILVFEIILIVGTQQPSGVVLWSLLKTIFLATATGGVFALVLTFLMKKYWIPDYLHETAALTFVVAAFLISNSFHEESGLLAVTIMGIVLTNQRHVPIKKIKDFKENLTVLMIPVLFILLSARLTESDIQLMSYTGIIFLLILIFIGRPLSVFLSTIKSGLSLNEKLFVSWMAPRGIVAAAVSSVFALKLTETGMPMIEYLVPLTFLVIIGTVILYGFTSPYVARLLKVSQSNPRGVIIAGAHAWARELAVVLKKNGFEVVIVDTNKYNISRAKMNGLKAYNESIISEQIIDKINLEGIGKLLALTSNDEANALGVMNFSEIFDKADLYQIHPFSKVDEKEFAPQYLRGRLLFGKDINFNTISEKFQQGAVLKSTKLTGEFGYKDFLKKYGQSVMPLFLIDNNDKLVPFTTDNEIAPAVGNTVISLVGKVN